MDKSADTGKDSGTTGEGGVLIMERYEITSDRKSFIEGLRQPFAVYQFLDGELSSQVQRF